MKHARRTFEQLALLVLLVGGFGTLVAMFLGTADVIGTQVFLTPVPGAREITESTIVLIVFGGLAYAQMRNNHIRVEIFYDYAGPRTRSAMDCIAYLMALIFFSLLIWQATNELLFSWEIGEATLGIVRIPLWPTRLILALGTALLLIQLVIDLIAALQRFYNNGDDRDSLPYEEIVE
jgi:TRAP-type C4-dicarboxylate transport system permease small subunit